MGMFTASCDQLREFGSKLRFSLELCETREEKFWPTITHRQSEVGARWR
jgi:hypothetical protein